MPKTAERILIKIFLHDDQDIQTTFEALIVQNSSCRTNVNELHYQTISRMCIRQASKCQNNCFRRFCWTVPYLASSNVLDFLKSQRFRRFS